MLTPSTPLAPPAPSDDEEKKWMAAYATAEKDHGAGGLLYVKDDECAYLMPDDERLPQAFRERLEPALDDDGGRSMFVVRELHRQLHVYTYNKLSAAARMA